MKKHLILNLLVSLMMVAPSYGQQKKEDLKMISVYGSENKELLDLFRFENIDCYKINFNGKELKSKTYTITVKEIWNGKIKSESTVFNSKEMVGIGMDKVNDTTLNIKVLSKLTSNNKLKISFQFSRFSTTKEYEAIESNEYSLRNLAEESKLEIGYNESFHFLAYILPYKRADGSKSWCEVGSSGKDVENWGKKFGIKHYLLFEMKFE
ncbi:hypothetical protein [Pedobacter frigiditerrae]|uniref:hypothetical protein n=1 Tax=Pedobacter frigiditerrae TaxID=2530452 RepID=UPI0029301A6D|nr:hypothetical protein [Pedobacter frigiditerrae]